jgi:hypothetical protein
MVVKWCARALVEPPAEGVLAAAVGAGKMALLAALASAIMAAQGRLVVVSTSTATLDLIDTLVCQRQG